MLANFHTHTTFSDGKNTPEETILYAIVKGFSAIGFSDHGFTPYDERYCMKDSTGYIKELNRLKEKYKNKIEIYIGIEEDSRALQNRANFDYIIGSCHYVEFNGRIYPFDSNYDFFSSCLEMFDNNALFFAEAYYKHFCLYIKERKPDIIGHFDLLTKFDESQVEIFLSSRKYWDIAKKYTLEALKSECIFEVNTGLIKRGFKTSPCPHERLLYMIAKQGGKVTLSSDSHCMETLDFNFAEMRKLLYEVGFRGIYILKDGMWQNTII